MANETDDPDQAADRLEAALERIARLAAQARALPEVRPPPVPTGAEPDADEPDADEPDIDPPATAEIAERLDVLIERLKLALGEKSGE